MGLELVRGEVGLEGCGAVHYAEDGELRAEGAEDYEVGAGAAFGVGVAIVSVILGGGFEVGRVVVAGFFEVGGR